MDSKAIMKPAIVLLVIAGVAAALLGAVSEVTKAPIAAQEQKTLNESMTAVMPEASSFEVMDTELTGTITAVYADLLQRRQRRYLPLYLQHRRNRRELL